MRYLIDTNIFLLRHSDREMLNKDVERILADYENLDLSQRRKRQRNFVPAPKWENKKPAVESSARYFRLHRGSGHHRQIHSAGTFADVRFFGANQRTLRPQRPVNYRTSHYRKNAAHQ